MEELRGIALGYKQGPLVELTAKKKLNSWAAVIWWGWHSTLWNLRSSVNFFYKDLLNASYGWCCALSVRTVGGGVQLLSHMWLFATPWTAADQTSLSFIISHSLLKLMSIELVVPSNHLVLCRPLFPPSVFPSIRVFSSESAFHIRWPKYWSFNFSPSNEYSRLISFRIDWFDLLAVQGTLKSLLQHHSSKSISSLVLSLLYGPTLTSIPEYWKNQSFDYMDLCWQSIVSAF